MCGVETRTLRLKLPPLTVVGATTDPDRLPRPLRDRFPIQLVLESYSAEAELVAILEAEAARNDLDDRRPRPPSTLARAAIGTPRKALNLLRRAADACLARTRQPGGEIRPGGARAPPDHGERRADAPSKPWALDASAASIPVNARLSTCCVRGVAVRSGPRVSRRSWT